MRAHHLTALLCFIALTACESKAPDTTDTPTEVAATTSAAAQPTRDEATDAKTPDAEDAHDSRANTESPPTDLPLVGEVRSDEVLAIPEWEQAYARTPVDRDVARQLQDVAEGATIEVVLGTWCPDSVREVTRFWKALEVAGEVPFATEYAAIGRFGSDAPTPALAAKLRPSAVPTFVVRREGKEVGRVVETSPHGIESDLLALLTGERTGFISATQQAPVER